MFSVSNGSIYTQVLTAENGYFVHAEISHTTKKIEQSLSRVYQIHDAQPCMIVDGSVAKSTEAEAKKPQEESLEKIENSTLTFTYQPKLIKMQSRDR